MSHSYLPFQRYDDEFKSLKTQVQQSLQSNDEFRDEEQPGNSANTGALVSQCEDLLQQMALEARSVPDAALKRELLTQVRACKSELQSLKDEHNKQSLMSGAHTGGNSSHRERLLQQQDMLRSQNSQLDNARKVLEETEQVALEIGTELGNNRDQIQSAHGRVRQVAGLTGRAKRIVQSMNQRAVQQKVILYGLSASIVVVFCVLAWWMH
jgi:vesicle transport through interaction with t-SNAREs protein 1